MARGTADFGLNPGNYGQFDQDNAELAVRLGSIDVFERKGRVIWSDDMTNGLYKYYMSLTGTAKCDYKMLRGVHNGAIIRYTIPGDSFSYPALSIALPVLVETKIAMEYLVRFEAGSAAQATAYYVYMNYYDGLNKYIFDHRISPSNKQITIITSPPPTGVSVVILHVPYDIYEDPAMIWFHYFKIVIDLQTKKYSRFVFNQIGGDLSMYPSAVVPFVRPPQLLISFVPVPSANLTYIDFCSPIITINEP